MAKRGSRHQKKWNRRMKIFFCCLGYKKNKESIADVASVFAEFFSDLNVPSSDVAAGFVLLSKYQAAQREWILKHGNSLGIDQYLSNIPVTQGTKFLDISTAEDSHLINDLIYYMNYSLAIFGWPMQVIDDPCMLCCIYPYLRLAPCCSKRDRKNRSSKNKDENRRKSKLSKASKYKSKHEKTDAEGAKKEDDTVVGQSISSSNEQHTGPSYTSIPGQLSEDCDAPIILEDNCCSCNAASAERRLEQHNYEIIFISYKSSVNVVPFLVAADHSKQAIVVAIRGSMSLSDMITDMNGTIDKVPIDDCPDDWLCHRGITSAAQNVKKSLLDEHILDRAFNCRPDLGSREYQLILCGHSLGAGAAAILGLLMIKRYPTLRAYLYSPPGGILSMPAVEYTKRFAIGIILGNDTVARLGVAQMERLRYQTLLCLHNADKSSGKILARALCPSSCVGSNKVDYDPDHSLDLLYGTQARSFNHNGTKIPFQSQSHLLYVPGRLIHIVKNYSFKSKTRRLWNGPIYQAVWTENASYDRILISEGMFFDHLPNNLMHSMKMLFSRTLPGRRDSKESTPSGVERITVEVQGEDERRIIEEPGERVVEVLNQREGNGEQGDKAQVKNVIEDDNNNNVEDENNNELGAKLYPSLHKGGLQGHTTNGVEPANNQRWTEGEASA